REGIRRGQHAVVGNRGNASAALGQVERKQLLTRVDSHAPWPPGQEPPGPPAGSAAAGGVLEPGGDWRRFGGTRGPLALDGLAVRDRSVVRVPGARPHL